MQEIEQRFTQLLSEADQLARRIPPDENMADDSRVSELQSWVTAAANLVSVVATAGSVYRAQVDRILNDSWLEHGFPNRLFWKMHGVLKSAADDWKAGLLRKIEYVVAASTFDDFLDHASTYHKGNRKVEASVLAAAVLEDGMKKVASRNNHPAGGKSLEQLIDELTASGVFTDVKAKRLKSAAALRNRALHAEWDAFDIQDVGHMVKTTRELIELYL